MLGGSFPAPSEARPRPGWASGAKGMQAKFQPRLGRPDFLTGAAARSDLRQNFVRESPAGQTNLC